MGKCSGLQLLVCWLNTKYWMFFFPILYCINSGMFLNLQNHHRNKEHFSFSPSTVSWKKHLTKVQLYKKQEVSFPSVAGLSCITNLKATRLAINIIMLLSKKKYIYIPEAHFLIQQQIKIEVSDVLALWRCIVSSLLPFLSKFDLFFIDAVKMVTFFCFCFLTSF